MKRIFLIFSIIFICNIEAREVKTIFGICEINDPLVEELIDSKIMQRLKRVDQSGVPYYFNFVEAFDRYSHSLGVYHLLKIINAPYKEQIAGLLHDSSHTAFSHLGDYIFSNAYNKSSYHTKDSFQDSVYIWYLRKQNCDKILEKYQLSLKDIDYKKEGFYALDQHLPDMCADRIEYNLHTALIFHIFDENKIKEIFEDIHYKEGTWYFTNVRLAKEFAQLSLCFTEHFWSSDWNYVIQTVFADAIVRAIELKIIDQDEILFGEDVSILEKLMLSEDEIIKKKMEMCKNISKYFENIDDDSDIKRIYLKSRGIDPLVLRDNQYVRLTSLDSEFKSEYERIKAKMKNGMKIRIKS